MPIFNFIVDTIRLRSTSAKKILILVTKKMEVSLNEFFKEGSSFLMDFYKQN